MPPQSSQNLPARRTAGLAWQGLALVLAALLLTGGLALVLGGAMQPLDVLQPMIVVLGGTVAALLLSFPLTQLQQALRTGVERGLQGGHSPGEIIRVMLKLADLSRRDGLLGVAAVRSNLPMVDKACQLIGEAAEDESIRFELERELAAEQTVHRLAADVFLFTAAFALAMGVLGWVIMPAPSGTDGVMSTRVAIMPLVIGISLALLMGILLARMRAVHLREKLVAEIAFRGVGFLLEDNNVQRLRTRLMLLVPPGLRA